MRYMLLTYYTKPNGQIDESVAIAKNIKTKDLQMVNVILDFKKLEVVKCSMGGVVVPRDFHKIVQYYMQHYENVIKRLFKENGYEIEHAQKPGEETQPPEANPS
jgi:hypothetical protein